MWEQVSGVGLCAASIEELQKIFAVAHRVVGCGRGRACSFTPVRVDCHNCLEAWLTLCNQPVPPAKTCSLTVLPNNTGLHAFTTASWRYRSM